MLWDCILRIFPQNFTGNLRQKIYKVIRIKQKVEIFLNYIGKIEIPHEETELTEEEKAQQEKERIRLEKKRACNRKYMARKREEIRREREKELAEKAD